jgi:intein/homing endonuclease
MNLIDTKPMMADAKFYESYSRYDSSTKTYETWNESVERVMEMHRQKYKDKIDKHPKLLEYISFAQKAYEEKKILGAQRALQFGGDQLLKHMMKMYNCSSSYADRAEFFGEYFYILLCGSGAGFSVQKHHVAKLPNVILPSKQAKIHVVDDSIEGWASALDVLMSSYFDNGVKHTEYQNRKVLFDLKQIRKKGAFISGGFKAPGPEPLRKALDKVDVILYNAAIEKRKLKPIEVYDICMHTADAVLSGGVRRSATICLFSLDDEEMINAKTGNWQQENEQRARSNNSVVLVRSTITFDKFNDVMQKVRGFGEPGFVFVDNTEQCFNPCVSGDTWVTTIDGPRQVKDIVDQPTKLLINGKFKETSERGFWKTGTKPVYEITLYNGMKLKATDNHKMLTSDDDWLEVKDLIVNEHSLQLSINDNSFSQQKLSKVKNVEWGTDNEHEYGWLVGNLIGDGTFESDQTVRWQYWNEDIELNKQTRNYLSSCGLDEPKINRDYSSEQINHKGKIKIDLNNNYISTVYSSRFASKIEKELGIKRLEKHITSSCEKMSSSFVKGLIGGLFDADGCIWGGPNNGLYVGITQTNLSSLQIVQRMLSRFGIVSNIYKERDAGPALLPDGNGGEKYYECKTTWNLRICGRYMVQKFFETVHITYPSKIDKYEKIIDTYVKEPYVSKKLYESKIVSINRVGVEDVYDCTVPATSCFDANGIVAHNCVEIGMVPNFNGKSGWQGCNLAEINGAMCDTAELFYEACKAAAIIATLQAGYTDFKFVSDITKKIFDREALLGVSVTGWMNNPTVLFDEAVQKKGAAIVLRWNKKVAEMIGINPAARATCAKPAGNASVLLMTASGIGGEHSKRYFRNVQLNKETEVVNVIKARNPLMVEESIWSSGKDDFVVSFPSVSKEGSIYKKDLYGVKQLEKVKIAQQNWVEYGTNVDLCVDKTVRHNISNTIIVDDWDEVERYIFENKDFFAGISLLSVYGDKIYYQAPFTEVLTHDEIVKKYNAASLFASGLIVDGLAVFDNLWLACETANPDNDGLGEDLSVETHQTALKSEWCRRFVKFADQYFNSDFNRCADCLKDVYLLHRWTKIQNNLLPIDWQNELGEKRYIDIDTTGASSCVGVNSCEIQF